MGLLLAAALLVPAAPAGAIPVCPDYHTPYRPPAGMWPGDAMICLPAYVSDLTMFQFKQNSQLPCGEAIQFYNLSMSLVQSEAVFLVAPPDDMELHDGAIIRFYLYDDPTVWGVELPTQTRVQIDYMVRNEYRQHVTLNLSDAIRRIDGVYNIGLTPNRMTIYEFDTILWTDASGGYFRFDIGPSDGALHDEYWLSSVQIGPRSQHDNFPAMCSSGDYIPPTPTPSPTVTPGGPTPTITPTPVSYATAPVVTLAPTTTATPIVFPTVPAEATATPYTIPLLSPLDFPTPAWPSVPPLTPAPTVNIQSEAMQIAEARVTQVFSGSAAAADIATRWAAPAADSWGLLDPGSTISGTTPISSTTETIHDAIGRISYPFRFLAATREIAPNTGAIVTILVGLFGLVLFTIFARFGSRVILTIVEVIRRLWEAIPLNVIAAAVGGGALLAALARPAPAAAQCTYNLTWPFDSEIPSEWVNGGWSFDAGWGRTDPGSIYSTYGGANVTFYLPVANALPLIGFPANSTVSSDNVDFDVYANVKDNPNGGVVHSMIDYAPAPQNNTSHMYAPASYSGWALGSPLPMNGENVAGFLIEVIGGTQPAWIDDVSLTIPCENVTPGTGTPTPTATPLPGYEEVIPTPVYQVMDNPELPVLPPAFDVPTPDPENRIDLAPMQTGMSDAVRALRTVPKLVPNYLVTAVVLVGTLVAVVSWLATKLNKKDDSNV